MQIDRCYCFQVRFAELRRVAKATDAASVSDLQRHRTFGQQCELCHPYVRRMLRTGQTCFGEVIKASDEPRPEPVDDEA